MNHQCITPCTGRLRVLCGVLTLNTHALSSSLSNPLIWAPTGVPLQHLSFTNATKIAPAKTNVPEIRFLTGTIPSSFRTATIGSQEQFSQ